MSKVVVFGAGGRLCGSGIAAEAAGPGPRGDRRGAAACEDRAGTSGDAVNRRDRRRRLGPESVGPLAKDADVLVAAGGRARAGDIYRQVAKALVGCGPDTPRGPGSSTWAAGATTDHSGRDPLSSICRRSPPSTSDMASGAGRGAGPSTAGASDRELDVCLAAAPVKLRGGAERTGHLPHRAGPARERAPNGEAGLSYEDMAVAVVDEIERPEFLNTRFTVGYLTGRRPGPGKGP